jgi:UDP-N-acetylmuramoyl-L-alanyl-D-glutamate--2,6-diaminopimelate ligase
MTMHEKSLAECLAGVCYVDPKWDRQIQSLALDSRQVAAGALFFAYPGTQADGREYIAQAIEAGARAIVAEAQDGIASETVVGDVPVFSVANVASIVSKVASRFYDHPSRQLTMIGITGTNGKTTCAYYLQQLLTTLGEQAALVGTLGYGKVGDLKSLQHTTPDAITIQKILKECLDAGMTHVAMEVSSHALDQDRVKHVEFDVGVFTNLTRDHLDYHETMEVYKNAKFKLFKHFGLRKAVINQDSSVCDEILKLNLDKVDVTRFSIESPDADVVISDLQLTRDGLKGQVSGFGLDCDFAAGCLGRFNASNVAAVLATLGAMGYPLKKILPALKKLKPVPGRMEAITLKNGALAVIDYAHTPDALEKALTALREHCDGRLVCVFGCGGDRDKGKRPLMGRVAQGLADTAIVTNDNPRSEVPSAIIDDILQGMGDDKPMVIEDRAQAIAHALSMAAADDVVLIAGKGHEGGQIIGERVLNFSDKAEVLSFIA